MRSMGDNKTYCVGLAITLVVFLIHGCGVLSSKTNEPIRTYILSAEIPTERPSVAPDVGTLLVNLPRAQSGFNTQRMAYVKREDEVSYFAFNQWAETPSRMFLPLLVKALERANLWDSVVQMPSPVRGDYQLIPENLLLQHEFTQKPSRVRIHLRLQLIQLKHSKVLATREFTVLENTKSDDPYGGVQASNVATGRLLQEIAAWLSLCMQEPTVGKC